MVNLNSQRIVNMKNSWTHVKTSFPDFVKIKPVNEYMQQLTSQQNEIENQSCISHLIYYICASRLARRLPHSFLNPLHKVHNFPQTTD